MPPSEPRRLLVTSALPYANGAIHLGHLVEYLQTDIWARYHRLVGNTCFYVCADDTHGTPIMLRAQKEGIAPEALIARMSEEHQRDFEAFGIAFDHYGSTHSAENRKHTEVIYAALRARGAIVEKEIEQAYCPKEEMFLPDRLIKGDCPRCKTADQYGDSCESCGATYAPTDLGNAHCASCGTPPVRKGSRHLFVRLQHFQEWLRAWVRSGTVPDEVANKLDEWLKDDLRDWDISRDEPYFGFRIPGEEKLYFYVWLDAPVGYLASTEQLLAKRNDLGFAFEDVWQKQGFEIHHFLGKDIVYFHTLFWPAMLHAAGLRTPNKVHVHGFLTVDGAKMSKSRGTFVSARTYLEHLDPVYLRYYYACKLTARVDDLDLNLEDFVDRVNADLVGKLVNLASRAGGSLLERLDRRIGAVPPSGRALLTEIRAAQREIEEAYEQGDYARVTRTTMALADRANKLFNEEAPWKSVAADPEAARGSVSTALNAARLLAAFLAPIVPTLVADLDAFLGEPTRWSALGQDLSPRVLGPFRHLLARLEGEKVRAMIDASKPADATPPPLPATPSALQKDPLSPECSIEDFGKIDLRVARIAAAEHVEGAGKLLKLTLDLGGGTTKNVFAGIKSSYAPEQLVGRLTVCVANLAPRKMRFGTSEAMVLAASNDAGLYILSPDTGAEPGLRVK
ncbi:MAG: methionine--tRNA ligase [Planctomycetes bacterium]|nr:methionine--tRNA ligase [Planctomycetota bacterium]